MQVEIPRNPEPFPLEMELCEAETFHQWPSTRRYLNGKRLTQTSRGSVGASFGLLF
jgi:hypothetical protein